MQWYDSLGKPIATNVPGLWVKPATNSYYVITQTVNGYYSTDTVHVGVRQPLPVSVVSGQLLVVSVGAVKFSWVCANEVNVLQYVVERSVDGRQFKEVGTVLASGSDKYSFVDYGVVGGVYYRLRIVDRDGAVSYSKVFSLPLTTNNLPLTISPNPAKDVVTISGKGIGEVQVIDSWGKVVLSTKANNGHTTLDIKRLSGGVYVVKAFRSEGVVTGKFLKQ